MRHQASLCQSKFRRRRFVSDFRSFGAVRKPAIPAKAPDVRMGDWVLSQDFGIPMRTEDTKPDFDGGQMDELILGEN
jgi:hypothetical protein